MAKYKVTYSCGHESVVELFGKETEREKKLEWMRDIAVCPDCYKEQLKAERDEANKAAAERAAEQGLPVLTGTEKQVAWANTIRDKFVSGVQTELDECAKFKERVH